MTIPPFPSQDLAKLVLGYLAEEQLMTAYDEFLQASPYLDARQNEYDRIFMTSLRNILAEYRAVKIYVETCRPFSLRKKLFQCSNLLEIVKFLINYIDINKLETLDKLNNVVKCQNSNVSKFNECSACNYLKLTSCVCVNKHKYDASHTDESSHSVETTLLADLPGNQARRKRPGRSLEKPASFSSSVQNNSVHSTNISIELLNNHKQQIASKSSNSLVKKNIDNLAVASLNSTVRDVNVLMESEQKIEEFNSILNKVCQNNENASITIQDRAGSKITDDGSFQDFASGVSDHHHEDSQIAVYPSSDTSNVLAAVNRDPVNIKNAQEVDKRDLLFKVEPKRKSQKRNSQAHLALQPKPPKEQKIKILSNVKVDSCYQSKEKPHKTPLSNATSTPVQVQTIFINGKPAYRTHPTSANLQNFTKDEILAMPTIIALPVSSQTSMSSHAQTITTNPQIEMTSTNAVDNCLGPLVIDVPASPTKGGDKTNTLESSNSSDLIKTVDDKNHPLKNPSVPKDSHLSNLVDTNTPLVLPVARKSSSTPRRTSHIRVLDFGTPRQEVINEKILQHNTNTHVEVFISRQSTTVGFDTHSANSTEETSNLPDKIVVVEESPRQLDSVNIKKPKVKSDWDADLRAMARVNEGQLMPEPKKNPKVDKKKKMKKPKAKDDVDKPDTVKLKSKKSRKKETPGIDLEEEVIIVQTDLSTIKPTINIKCGNDWSKPLKVANEKETEVKPKENDGECTDTPETERLTLQNVVGAKLNISELLETPYKQAFYDIQMETPRCLVPDLPGEPMSDLKIMNIPTPRFFDSPKIVHLTPSSYSSRPTDYSSGGSYYKPDDQDFLHIRDLECPILSPKAEPPKETSKEILDDGPKSSRPVRQCAKNVSYYRNSRMKDSEYKSEDSSPNNETLTIKGTLNDKEEEKHIKLGKNTHLQEMCKSDVKKRNSKTKRKSPVIKEKSRSFMKIKPRVRTPCKENMRRTRKTSTLSNTPKTQRKIKERNTNDTPLTPFVPTKSRRKSSTPRKLHCNKNFNSENAEHPSPKNAKETKTESCGSISTNTQDSDVEQLALRWSDDGSQDIKNVQELSATNDVEDLSKIQEFIQTTDEQNDTQIGTLQIDLIKRGFDVETAKIIERDLLDTPPRNDGNLAELDKSNYLSTLNKENDAKEKTPKDDSICTDIVVTNQTLEENECEVELSISECNEDSNNFFVCEYIQASKQTNSLPVTLKESFSMEICVDNDMTIRLRATPFTVLFDEDPSEALKNFNFKETEDAVNSITSISKLYTPLKDSAKAKCYEIFDSTLTSLDTPLKASSPKKTDHEVTVSEIVVERHKVDLKDKTETKKRKRPQSNSIDEPSENKKTKPDPQYLLSSANIQNIDIESVLQKLHGS